jgi:hypothetical protein
MVTKDTHIGSDARIEAIEGQGSEHDTVLKRGDVVIPGPHVRFKGVDNQWMHCRA